MKMHGETIKLISREYLAQPDYRTQQYCSNERHHVPQPTALSSSLGTRNQAVYYLQLLEPLLQRTAVF